MFNASVSLINVFGQIHPRPSRKTRLQQVYISYGISKTAAFEFNERMNVQLPVTVRFIYRRIISSFIENRKVVVGTNIIQKIPRVICRTENIYGIYFFIFQGIVCRHVIQQQIHMMIAAMKKFAVTVFIRMIFSRKFVRHIPHTVATVYGDRRNTDIVFRNHFVNDLPCQYVSFMIPSLRHNAKFIITVRIASDQIFRLEKQSV